jgi:hypothetical protein
MLSLVEHRCRMQVENKPLKLKHLKIQATSDSLNERRFFRSSTLAV